jgi:hypothetical protein
MTPEDARAGLRALFANGAVNRGKELELKETKKTLLAHEKARRLKGSFAVGLGNVDALNALARRIADELRWHSCGLVTVFTEQHCLNCDSNAVHLTGIMVEQEHKTEKGTRRLLRSVENHPLLPKRRETWVENVEVCTHCYSNVSGLPVIAPFPLLQRKDHEEIQNDPRPIHSEGEGTPAGQDDIRIESAG